MQSLKMSLTNGSVINMDHIRKTKGKKSIINEKISFLYEILVILLILVETFALHLKVWTTITDIEQLIWALIRIYQGGTQYTLNLRGIFDPDEIVEPF